MKYKVGLTYLFMAFMLSSCDWFSSEQNKRINIGIIIQKTIGGYDSGLLRGAKLAIDELNKQGGLLSKQVYLIPKDTREDINEEVIVAEQLIRMKNLLAVIGHLRSDGTIPVSSIYERAKVIMITPSATSNLLTEYKRNFIFRMVSSNKDMGELLAKYFVSQQLKNVIILYPRSEYGQDIANYYEKNATESGINIVDRRSYFEQSGNYTDLLNFWKRNYDFDSILLPGDMPDGPEILNQIRHVGINVPVIGGDSMANTQLIEIAAKNAEGVVAIDFEDMEHWNSEGLRAFKDKYVARYKVLPEAQSLLGYDAVMLLANAVKKTQSVDNQVVADYLHKTVYQGLAAKYQFDNKGNNIAFTKPYLKKVINGVFKVIVIPKSSEVSQIPQVPSVAQ
jgi:branched-chain amino acid transport system substrate-binding protein